MVWGDTIVARVGVEDLAAFGATFDHRPIFIVLVTPPWHPSHPSHASPTRQPPACPESRSHGRAEATPAEMWTRRPCPKRGGCLRPNLLRASSRWKQCARKRLSAYSCRKCSGESEKSRGAIVGQLPPSEPSGSRLPTSHRMHRRAFARASLVFGTRSLSRCSGAASCAERPPPPPLIHPACPLVPFREQARAERTGVLKEIQSRRGSLC